MPVDKDAKKVTMLVNYTEFELALYKVTANGNKFHRKTLNPSPQSDSTATLTTDASTLVSNISEAEVVRPDTHREELIDTETYGTLRVYHKNKVVLHVSSDQMLDNEVIDIVYEDEFKTFKTIPRGRPAKGEGSDITMPREASSSMLAVSMAAGVPEGASSPATAADDIALLTAGGPGPARRTGFDNPVPGGSSSPTQLEFLPAIAPDNTALRTARGPLLSMSQSPLVNGVGTKQTGSSRQNWWITRLWPKSSRS